MNSEKPNSQSISNHDAVNRTHLPNLGRSDRRAPGAAGRKGVIVNDTFRPRNQADCDHANALREYEAAHKTWMNTSIFQPETVRNEVTRTKNEARAKYEAAYKAANPTHILL